MEGNQLQREGKSVMDKAYRSISISDIKDIHIHGSRQQRAERTCIANVDAFCINTVLKALSCAGLKPGEERYIQISKATAKLIIRGRRAICTGYSQSREVLKDWILWKVGLRENVAFERMEHMGLTGNILHDMEVLECSN